MYLTKKIITASFLLLLLAIPVLFSVTILLHQKILHYQREERMSKEMLLTITVSSHDIFWVKKGKEILFDGKLFDVKSYLFPGPFGLTGFYDVGRVWLNGEDSRKWHSAFGGGFYFMPFNLFVISASAGFSAQEKVMNFAFGSKINLRF